MQRSALCRSWRELSNAYLLVKFGVDTAEKEPCRVRPSERSGEVERAWNYGDDGGLEYPPWPPGPRPGEEGQRVLAAVS